MIAYDEITKIDIEPEHVKISMNQPVMNHYRANGGMMRRGRMPQGAAP
jgi:hypothetical protein